MSPLPEGARGWSHGEYVEYRRKYVLHVLQQAASGEIGLLLAVREINSALHELPELEKRIEEDDFVFFTAVASECDGLPLGSERQYWAPAALREKDTKIQAYEQAIREETLTVFARIADHLKEPL